MMIRDETPSWGARVLPDRRVRFALWAPAAHRLSVSVQGLNTLLPMNRDPDGWHQLVTDQVVPGSLYEFVLPNGSTVPGFALSTSGCHRPQRGDRSRVVLVEATGLAWSSLA
jgi:1,4-alpha-glucan branching enzyme